MSVQDLSSRSNGLTKVTGEKVDISERELTFKYNNLKEENRKLQEKIDYLEKMLKRANQEKIIDSINLEKELGKKSEHLLNLTRYINELGNNSPDLIIQIEVIDNSGKFRVLHLNDAAVKYYNIPAIKEQTFNKLFDFLPGDIDNSIESFSELRNGICFHSKSEDEKKYWETHLYSILSNEDVTRLVLISREVTIRYKNEYLSFVLEASINSWGSPYWVCNAKNEIIIQNNSCKKVWGDKTGQMFNIDIFPHEIRSEIKLGLALIYKGKTFTIQYPEKTSMGIKYFLLKLSPMKSNLAPINGFSGLVYDITERKELEQQVLSSVIQTEEKERTYFSQELHDSVNPLLSAAGIYTDWLEDPEKKISQAEIIRDLRSLIQEAYNSSREIAHKLSPHVLEQSGFVEAIKVYCERVKKSSSIEVSVSEVGNYRPENNIEIVLYRVLCECIVNTIKHAEAKNIKIDIVSKHEEITVCYSDNGKGFNMKEVLESKRGIGLLIIEDRIKYINGSMSLFSKEGKGFLMEIKICNSGV